MSELETLSDKIRIKIDELSVAHNQAIILTRLISRVCSQAINALHKEDMVNAEINLIESRKLVEKLQLDFADIPQLYYESSIQDALIKFVEANVAFDLIQNRWLLTPEELGVDSATYANGLAKVIGVLHQKILEILRQGDAREVELLLSYMDQIYMTLVNMDYPDSTTNGLRINTDRARVMVEKTREDVTFSLRANFLVQALRKASSHISDKEEP
jgi:translin